MAKMVIIIDDAHDAASVARDVASIPGVSVTSLTEGFVDVDAASKGSLVQLERNSPRAAPGFRSIASPMRS